MMSVSAYEIVNFFKKPLSALGMKNIKMLVQIIDNAVLLEQLSYCCSIQVISHFVLLNAKGNKNDLSISAFDMLVVL